MQDIHVVRQSPLASFSLMYINVDVLISFRDCPPPVVMLHNIVKLQRGACRYEQGGLVLNVKYIFQICKP